MPPEMAIELPDRLKAVRQDLTPYLHALQLTRAQRLADEIAGARKRTEADEMIDRLLDAFSPEPETEYRYQV